MTLGKEAREWLAKQADTSHDDFTLTQLKGSTSSSLFLMHLRGTEQRFVLRVLDNREWLAKEPDLAQHEGAALQEAQKTGVPSPQCVAFSNADVGFGAPVVLMSFLEGEVQLCPTNFEPWLNALGRQLAHLHRHSAPNFAWQYSSWVNVESLAAPVWSTVPHIWKQAIALARGDEPEYRPVFIHRDFHPTNVLWSGDSISGVVDWINACRGPAGIDVAHCRSNLTMMFGHAAADRFLELYVNHADGYQHLPYWDINSILDMSLLEPGFYKPWAEFGLSIIAPEVLRQRMEDYLIKVMQNA